MTTLELRERLAYTLILQEDLGAQAFFRDCLERGETAQAALMFATRRAPGVRGGDRVFNEQARYRMDTMLPMNRERILEIARKAGISTQGKFYCGGLGRYDDPDAWVSTVDDVKAVAKKKGLIVEGAVRHDPGTPDPLPPPRLAPDLVQELSTQYVSQDPVLQEKMKKKPKRTAAEVAEMVVEKHGRRK